MAEDRQKQSSGNVRSLTGEIAVSYSRSGYYGGSDWFGPMNPLPPMAPSSVKGRILDYPQGFNQRIRPRDTETISFEALRGFADSYDLLRLVIETRKDQLGRMRWNIVPRDYIKKQRLEAQRKTQQEKLKARQKGLAEGKSPDEVKEIVAKFDDGNGNGTPDELDNKILEIKRFFIRPDGVHFWDEWLRLLLEDLFVIDAPTLFRRKTYGGDLFALEPIDGGTIKRVIDQWGKTPQSGPAYQQCLKGMPAVDYTAKDLIYRPRNIRTHKIYGFSPVEQIIMTVNIALRRQIWQLQTFTEGNIPEALIGVPGTWTPDQIAQFQTWFDSMMTGNTAERSRGRFVPGEVAKSFVLTKQDELFGAAEEWLARVVCYCFSVSPQPFIKMMNRATAESAQEAAVEEGLAPLQNWIKGLMDLILIEDFQCEDLEFEWEDEDELDPDKKSQILDRDFAQGRMTFNEVRAAQGQDLIDHPNADRPMALKDGALVPLFPTPEEEAEAKAEKERQEQLETLKATKVPPDDPEASGGASPGQDDPSTPPAKGAVSKSDWWEWDIDREETLAKRYNPSQPRYPKGHPDGGKWRDDYPAGTSEHVKAIMSADEVRELQELINEGAPKEEILKKMKPFYDVDHPDAPTLVVPEDGKVDPAFFVGRKYILPDGTQTNLEGAVAHLMAEGDKTAGPFGPGMERRAIMLIGPPAAGKSTLAEGLAKEGYAIVDADEAKKLIPGYNGGLGAQSVHEESSVMSKIVQAQYAKSGKNVLIQTTSFNPASAAAKIEMLHRAGYRVDVVGMSISTDEAVRRMARRAIRTGRSVPMDVVVNSPVSTMNTFEAVKGLGDGYARVYAGGSQPIVAESSIGWLTPGAPVLRKSGDGGGTVLGAGDGGGIRLALRKSDNEVPQLRLVKSRWLHY